MPTSVAHGTAAADRVLLRLIIPTEEHIIFSASLFQQFTSAQPNDAYGIIGLMAGGENINNRISILASGYFGSAAAIGWTGQLPTWSNTFVYADIYSTEGGKFRATAILWKYLIKDGIIHGIDP